MSCAVLLLPSHEHLGLSAGVLDRERLLRYPKSEHQATAACYLERDRASSPSGCRHGRLGRRRRSRCHVRMSKVDRIDACAPVSRSRSLSTQWSCWLVLAPSARTLDAASVGRSWSICCRHRVPPGQAGAAQIGGDQIQATPAAQLKRQRRSQQDRTAKPGKSRPKPTPRPRTNPKLRRGWRERATAARLAWMMNLPSETSVSLAAPRREQIISPARRSRRSRAGEQMLGRARRRAERPRHDV